MPEKPNETTLELPSYCKINWHLRVLGKRADGFHELCTVFQTVSLGDRLFFSPSEELSLTSDDPSVPTGEDNLIIRAGRLLQVRFQIKNGARIHLEKRIPSPGGLGGGSSNAAVALLALARLWDLDVEFSELLDLARKLGSDVPFFLYGGTALGAGRGTEIFPLPEIEEKFILIVTPDEKISTAEAFARLNATGLTKAESKSILQICRKEAQTLDLRQKDLINDFEESVFRAAPEIKRVKTALLELGSRQALLSGSGASVFGVFDTEETRQTAQKALASERDWRSFAVATVSRAEYRAALDRAYQFASDSF
jgi:4-diphosphocytidyl-2-C-methyl-D-erythritol kinase